MLMEMMENKRDYFKKTFFIYLLFGVFVNISFKFYLGNVFIFFIFVIVPINLIEKKLNLYKYI
jgi:hypothetical protein